MFIVLLLCKAVLSFNTFLLSEKIKTCKIPKLKLYACIFQAAAEIGMEGKTFSEISQALKDDPDQRFSSKDELLSTYRNTVYNTIYPLIHQMFSSVPADNIT